MFEKVEDLLYTIYRMKNVDAASRFNEKQKQIFERYTLEEILVEVSLHRKYWSID